MDTAVWEILLNHALVLAGSRMAKAEESCGPVLGERTIEFLQQGQEITDKRRLRKTEIQQRSVLGLTTADRHDDSLR